MPFQLPLRILSTWLAVWLAGGVYASSELILGQWALANFTMSCPADGHSCAYRFQIVEGVDGTGGPTTECRFTIDSQGVPATLLNFTTQSCDGSDAYRVNGGWDPLGFITLCVSHASEDTWAFFGYESWQVVNAIAAWMNVRPAYKMFTFNETDERAVGERAEARGRQELIVGSRAMGTERERRRERVPDSPRSQSLSRQVSDNDYYLTWTIEEFQRDTARHDPSAMNEARVSFKILVTETRNGSTYSRHDAACCVDEMADGDGTRHDTAALGVYHQPCHGSEDGYYFSWQLSSSLDAGWLAVFNPKKSLQLGTVVYFAQESPYLGPWAPGQAKL